MLEMINTSQEEREQREATEFIEILKSLSDVEKAEVRGYMKCLHNIRILTVDSTTEKRDGIFV